MHKKLYEILCKAEEIAAKRCDFAENCDDCPADNKGFDCFEWIKVDSLMNLGVTIPVRCKDCVYYREEVLLCVGVSCVGDSHANWYPEDFCSYGERKGDGNA